MKEAKLSQTRQGFGWYCKMLAKEILERYATVVIPKNKDTIFHNPNSKRPWGVKARWLKDAGSYQYTRLGYSKSLCLWVPPVDCLVIEFESNRKQNEDWIKETEKNCLKNGLDYCVCDHEGKSPYVWAFNINGMKTHAQRKALSELLIPKGANIDLNNLGLRTLVPVIEHPHWKYGWVHKIVRGKNPVQHENSLPKSVYQISVYQESSLPLCDVQLTQHKQNWKEVDKDMISKILSTDFRVQQLIAGNITRYKTPSHARMALYFCLVGYGLSDSAVYFIMSKSTGLNFQEKPHLHKMELEKARQKCCYNRQILEKKR